jgi:hypothetical protein
VPNEALGALLNRGWAVVPNFIESSTNLLKELQFLEKDGKFEERPWIGAERAKILGNPESFVELVDTHDRHLFPSLRETALLLCSLPFELNLKANLFCTVSPNLHICYSGVPCKGRS